MSRLRRLLLAAVARVARALGLSYGQNHRDRDEGIH